MPTTDASTPAGASGTAQWLVRLLAVALAYFVAGRLALLMAIPPGYATPVWPAAGIGLALALVWDVRAVVPGIVLGSVLVNAGTSFDASSGRAAAGSLAVALGIGLGAGAQAAVGRFLVRRRLGFPIPLDDLREIVTFAALTGPVACVTSATVGSVTLGVAGVVPLDHLWTDGWTWWVGDTVGVLVFTPLALTFLEPHPAWRGRRAAVAPPLVVGFAIVAWLFVRVSAWEEERLEDELARQAVPIAHALEGRLGRYEDVLLSVASLFASSTEVTREEFGAFTLPALERHTDIQALGWCPVTRAEEQEGLVEAAHRDGLQTFALKERGPAGRLVPVAARDAYVPVFYIEPSEGNEDVPGFDLASDPARADALARARASGAPSATGPLTLVLGPGREREPGFLLVVPVNGSEGVRGYAVGAFRLAALLDTAVRGLDTTGHTLALVDVSDPDDARPLLLRADIGGPVAGDRLWHRTLAFGGRTWSLEIRPTTACVAGRPGWQAWMVQVGGLSIVALLGVMLLVTTGRTFRIEQAAARSAEAEARYRSVFDSDMLGMMFWDASGNISDANDTFLGLVGFTRDDLVSGRVRWSDMTPVEYLDLDRRALDALARHGVVTPYEKEYIRKDGSRVAVEIGAAVHDGVTDRGICFVREVTERKAAALALQRAHDELEDRVRERTRALEEEIVHRERVERARQAVEGKLQRLADSNVIGVFVASGGIVREANRAFLETMGHSTEDLGAGRIARDSVVPAAWAEVLAGDGRRGVDTRSVRFEKDHVRADGSMVPVLVAAAELGPDEQVGFVADRSALVRAETALQESQAYARSVLDGAQDAFVGMDADGRITDWNPRAERIFGWSRDEILGRLVGETLVPSTDLHRDGLAHLLAPGPLQTADRRVELVALRKDGREIVVERTISAAHRNGAVELGAFFQDITERKRIEAERDGFFTMSLDMLCVAGFDGYYKRLNPAWEKLGWTREELMARPYIEFVHPDDRPATTSVSDHLSEGDPTLAFENRYRCADGTWRVLQWRAVPSPEHGLIFAVARDVTQLREAQEAVRTSLAEKEILLKEIHHRVKNNLQVISSVLKLHGEEISDPAGRSAFQGAQDRVRAIALLHERLYQSKDLGSIVMADYVESVVQTLLRTWGSVTPARVSIDAPGVSLPVDLAVPCGLILNELVTNALKHGFPTPGDRPEIAITLSHDGEHVTLSVADNGAGLPAGFDRLQTRSLGMHLVRTLGRQLQADISTDSGPGTRWILRFPFRPEVAS